MVLKVDFKKLLISLAIPLGIGAIAALITKGDMDIYKDIAKPPLSPPSIVFPIVWAILYVLIGIALYRVWTSKGNYDKKREAYIYFAVQMFLNFIWTPAFFSARQFLLAVIILAALLLLSIIMAIKFCRIDKIAGYLLIPYIIWLCCAMYLNIGVYLLNR